MDAAHAGQQGCEIVELTRVAQAADGPGQGLTACGGLFLDHLAGSEAPSGARCLHAQVQGAGDGCGRPARASEFAGTAADAMLLHDLVVGRLARWSQMSSLFTSLHLIGKTE
jgi:hypothetical protein